MGVGGVFFLGHTPPLHSVPVSECRGNKRAATLLDSSFIEIQWKET